MKHNPNPTTPTTMENTMEFVLKIRCRGAAFTDEVNWEDPAADDLARAQEVLRILSNIDPERVTLASVAGHRGTLLDINGNTVGHFEFRAERPE